MSTRTGLLDRGWDLQVLSRISPRQLFVLAVIMWFALGLDIGFNFRQGFGFGQLDASELPWFLVYAILVFRYSRLAYKRLEH